MILNQSACIFFLKRLGELGKSICKPLLNDYSHSISHSPKLPLMFPQLHGNMENVLYLLASPAADYIHGQTGVTFVTVCNNLYVDVHDFRQQKRSIFAINLTVQA